MLTATKTEFVVDDNIIAHVKTHVLAHLRKPQKRRVPKTSQVVVDRVMAAHDDIFPDKFWSRVSLWYTKVMDRTLPKLRGFAATDFFEIVAAHMRNDEETYGSFAAPLDDIEDRARHDAYVTCSAGLYNYTQEYEDAPHHAAW
jgi:hypothetical protein